MLPQTLLRSLSATHPLPVSSSKQSATHCFSISQSCVESFEENAWRAFLFDNWYLLGKTSHWEKSDSGEDAAIPAIEWTCSTSVTPLSHLPHGAASLSQNEAGVSVWQGVAQGRGIEKEGDKNVDWFVVHTPSLRPVAHLTQHWGTPPKLVRDDWSSQVGVSETAPDSIWILTTPDGLLYRIDHAMSHSSDPAMPAPTTSKVLSLDAKRGKVREPANPANPTKTQHSRKRSFASRLRIGAIAALALTSSCWLLWTSLPNSNRSRESEPHSVEAKPFEGIRIEGDKEVIQLAETLSLDLSLSPETSLSLKPFLPHDGPIPQFPTMESASRLKSDLELPDLEIPPTANRTWQSIEPAGAAPIRTTETNAQSDSDTESILQDSESVASGIRRAFTIQAGVVRHRIETGISVAPTHATCQATLTLTDVSDQGTTLTPSVPCLLIGDCKQQWIFALEEESCELVIELESRPARRWELWIRTGVREHRHAPVFLIRANQATQSIEQLANAERWAKVERDQLQLLLDSGLAKGLPSPWQRRRQLQTLEKELERSLEIWKVVERLSLLFIDHAQLEVILSNEVKSDRSSFDERK